MQLVLAVGEPRVGGCGVADVRGGVDVEHRWHVLQHRRHPIQTHPGVDALGRQIADHVIWLVLDVLHEDEIPDLHEAVLIADRRTAALPELGPLVEEDLELGPQGPGTPICQKFSFVLRLGRSAGTIRDQISAASSSVSNTVYQRSSGSSPRRSVTNS